METIKEVNSPTSSEIGLAYGLDKHKTNVEIAIQRLKLVSLNISKVMIDLIEESGNSKLLYEDTITLQNLNQDINEIIIFMNHYLVNKS